MEDTSFQNPTRARRAGSPARPSPLRDSIRSKDARPEPPGGVQVKTNFGEFPPLSSSGAITRAPNVPSPASVWFPSPPPTPSHSVKIQKSLDRASSPPTGRDGPDPELNPPRLPRGPRPTPRWKRSSGAPASRQESGRLLHLGLPGSPKTRNPLTRMCALISQLCQSGEKPQIRRPSRPRPRKPYKTGSETVSRQHCLCQQSQTLLTSSLFFSTSKKPDGPPGTSRSTPQHGRIKPGERREWLGGVGATPNLGWVFWGRAVPRAGASGRR